MSILNYFKNNKKLAIKNFELKVALILKTFHKQLKLNKSIIEAFNMMHYILPLLAMVIVLLIGWVLIKIFIR